MHRHNQSDGKIRFNDPLISPSVQNTNNIHRTDSVSNGNLANFVTRPACRKAGVNNNNNNINLNLGTNLGTNNQLGSSLSHLPPNLQNAIQKQQLQQAQQLQAHQLANRFPRPLAQPLIQPPHLSLPPSASITPPTTLLPPLPLTQLLPSPLLGNINGTQVMTPSQTINPTTTATATAIATTLTPHQVISLPPDEDDNNNDDNNDKSEDNDTNNDNSTDVSAIEINGKKKVQWKDQNQGATNYNNPRPVTLQLQQQQQQASVPTMPTLPLKIEKTQDGLRIVYEGKEYFIRDNNNNVITKPLSPFLERTNYNPTTQQLILVGQGFDRNSFVILDGIRFMNPWIKDARTIILEKLNKGKHTIFISNPNFESSNEIEVTI